MPRNFLECNCNASEKQTQGSTISMTPKESFKFQELIFHLQNHTKENSLEYPDMMDSPVERALSKTSGSKLLDQLCDHLISIHVGGRRFIDSAPLDVPRHQPLISREIHPTPYACPRPPRRFEPRWPSVV
jgi:hypothetical protein